MSITWVDYSYFAERLNLKVQTIRAYATGDKQKVDDFPRRVNDTSARTPYFDQNEADMWIEQRLADGKARKADLPYSGQNETDELRVAGDRERATSNPRSKPATVDYSYIARRLNLRPRDIRAYATEAAEKGLDFPQRVNSPTAEKPLFDREEAESWVSARAAEGWTISTDN